jgi:hypothetical protein
MLSFLGAEYSKITCGLKNQRPRNWQKNFIKASGLRTEELMGGGDF